MVWQNRAMTNTGEKTHKRGHNTMVTGLAMLVIGVVIALGSAGENGSPGLQGWAVLVALAGFITLLVGVGRRRETPPTS